MGYQIIINSVCSADYIDDNEFAKINLQDKKRKSVMTIDLGGEDNYILRDEYIDLLQAEAGSYGKIVNHAGWFVSDCSTS